MIIKINIDSPEQLDFYLHFFISIYLQFYRALMHFHFFRIVTSSAVLFVCFSDRSSFDDSLSNYEMCGINICMFKMILRRAKPF